MSYIGYVALIAACVSLVVVIARLTMRCARLESRMDAIWEAIFQMHTRLDSLDREIEEPERTRRIRL